MASYRADVIDDINKLNAVGKYEKSLRKIQDYLKKHPFDECIRLEEAHVYIKLYKKNDARIIFENIIQTSSKDSYILKSLSELAELEASCGNYERAITLYKTYLDNVDTKLCISVRCKMSKIYCCIGDYKNALDIINVEGIKNLQINNARAQVYFYLREYDKCLEVLNEIDVSSSCDNKVVLNNYALKASACIKLKKYNEAIGYHKLVINNSNKVNGAYYSAKLELATVYQVYGDTISAIRECEDVLAECKSPKILNKTNYTLGLIYLSMHDDEKSYKYFSQCYDNDRNIGYAKIAYYNGDFNGALNFVSKISITDNYLYRDVHILIAQIMFRLKRYKDFANAYYKVFDNNENIGNKTAFNADTYSIEFMRIYVDKFCGVRMYGSRTYLGQYAYKQILSYDKEKAINHIKNRHTGHSYDNNSYFKEGTDIENLFTFVQEHLPECKRKFEDSKDLYLLDLRKLGCPYSDELIEVICNFNSYDIVTMYPVGYREHYEQIEASKVRSKKNIDKFNKKYGL
nr:hypothetical protein [Bacilli bacterium]